MPNTGIRRRASKAGRTALSVALGSGFLALAAAAPASATQLVLSGTTQSTACVISGTGALDACNGSVLDSTSVADDTAVLLHFDIAGNLPAGNCVDDADVWVYRTVGNPSWLPGFGVYEPRAHPEYTPWNTSATWLTPDGVNEWVGGYPEYGYPENFYEADAHWMYTDTPNFIDYDVIIPNSVDLAGPASANAPKLVVEYSAC